MGYKVLVIDDDENIRELIKVCLTKEDFEITTAQSGNDGIAMFKIFKPDLVLLDIMMPDKDGLAVCREIREISSVPIIMLTAKSEEFDKVLGLELGADDYIVKPFGVKEIGARIKAILRRKTNEAQKDEETETIKFEHFEISMARYELKLKGKVVEMPPKELEVLYFLASNPNRVFTRDQLLDKVWGYDFLGDSRTVDVHIKRLRDKLNGASEQWYIKTVWGVGYKFELLQ
jgi:DNA-binding response OmpR family regulator